MVVNDDPEEFEIRPAPDRLLGLLFGRVPEPKSLKNRLHLDFRLDDRDAAVARLVDLGATRADVGQGEQSWIVLSDPEGNEFCVLSSRDRSLPRLGRRVAHTGDEPEPETVRVPEARHEAGAQLRVGVTGSGEQGEALRGMDRTAAGEPEGVDPRGYGEVEAYPREHVTVGDVETFVMPMIEARSSPHDEQDARAVRVFGKTACHAEHPHRRGGDVPIKARSPSSRSRLPRGRTSHRLYGREGKLIIARKGPS